MLFSSLEYRPQRSTLATINFFLKNDELKCICVRLFLKATMGSKLSKLVGRKKETQQSHSQLTLRKNAQTQTTEISQAPETVQAQAQVLLTLEQ